MRFETNSKPILTNISERSFLKPSAKFGNCLKGCQWAPDGSCICTNSDDHRIRIFNLPERFINLPENNEVQTTAEEIFPVLELKESQIIYDYCWYPFMNSSDYATCFLLCCSRDVPIHLWDAYSGKIFGSYVAEDNVFELVSARSVRFNSSGRKILAGYDKFICQFDLSRPGRHGDYIYDIPKGIVSCLTCNDKLFVTGSFNRLIGLYDPGSMENIATLQGHKGGLTHLMLSPDGNRLYSGARKDNEILCWDLRNYGSILHIIQRNCPTNQRIYFDIDFQGNLLVTGDECNLKFYNLNLNEPNNDDQQQNILKCFNEFQPHSSRVNGVSLHPTLPLVATTSGERCILEFADESEEDSGNIFDYKRTYLNENNMKFWWFKQTDDNVPSPTKPEPSPSIDL